LNKIKVEVGQVFAAEESDIVFPNEHHRSTEAYLFLHQHVFQQPYDNDIKLQGITLKPNPETGNLEWSQS